MKKARRTNYSPVRQMSRTIQDEFPQTAQSEQVQQLDFELEQPPEEVYIYNCCGVSKELEPAIKFMSTFKALFFLFNFLVFAFALCNVGMGLWFRIDPKIYEIHKYIETQNFTLAGWLMLFCGFATCLIALMGFAAAARQVAGQLVAYFIAIIILTVAFIGTLVLLTVYGFGSTLEEFLKKEINEQIRRRSMNSETNLLISNAALFLDFVQVKMRCCGATNHNDYLRLGMVVPTTCSTIDKNYILAPGCGRAIRDLLDLRAGLAAGFTSGSIIAQLITIVLSAMMFCSIYHHRATSRPATPMTPVRRGSPSQLYQQRPRSRTPIVL